MAEPANVRAVRKYCQETIDNHGENAVVFASAVLEALGPEPEEHSLPLTPQPSDGCIRMTCRHRRDQHTAVGCVAGDGCKAFLGYQPG